MFNLEGVMVVPNETIQVTGVLVIFFSFCFENIVKTATLPQHKVGFDHKMTLQRSIAATFCSIAATFSTETLSDL